MVANADRMRYANDSIDLMQWMQSEAYRRTSDIALEHARVDGREVVTYDDVLAVVRAALEEVAADTVSSEDAEPTHAIAEAAAR